MKDITIVTFISNNEKINEDFFTFYNLCKNNFNVEAIVFSDKSININDESIKLIIKSNTTKYIRIIQSIKSANSNNILFIDNDIIINHENLKKLIKIFINSNNKIAWGKIKSQKVKGIVPNLIKIDKNLSHDFIRPILWKIKLGISVPGQVFLIKREAFLEKLPNIDTVYDDLTIGMIARKNKFEVYYSNLIFGEEYPKGNFVNLLKQRKRWARGMAQSIQNSKKINMTKFVILHAFMYHLLWIVFYLLLILIGIYSLPIASIIFLLICIMLSEFHIKDALWSFIYMITFPIIHSIWLINFIKYCIYEKNLFNFY